MHMINQNAVIFHLLELTLHYHGTTGNKSNIVYI